ncbi:MAG: chondroitinase-B domain-containing protein [Bacteroidota bacterium]
MKKTTIAKRTLQLFNCFRTPTTPIPLLFLALLFSLTAVAQTIVTDGEELQNLVNAAMPGDVFIVQNGTYNDFEAVFTAVAQENNPITVRAESIGGVTLTGDSHFVLETAAHIIIEGFVFDCEGDNTLIKLEGSNNIRITRNVFELTTVESVKWVYIGGIYNDYTFQHTSHHNRIDHNIFQNKATPGHYITIDGTSNEDGSVSLQSQYDRIDHNYFKNNSSRAANEQESIRIGWSQMSMSSGFTTVEHNLFEDCDGDPEIVSVKSSDNIIRHNTFRRSYGTLSLRHGNRNRVEGNYFFGDGKPNGNFNTSTIYTGGIRIYGTDHVIVNNYMEGLQGTIWDAPIALTQGDAIDGNSTNLTKHFRAERVTIAYNTLVNNTHGIEIGYDKSGDYNKKLKDITIANNVIIGTENSLVTYIDGNDQDGEVSWFNNIMYPTGAATLVSGGPDFNAAEVNETDPILNFDGTLWRATAASPTVESAVPALSINQDIDGHPRPDVSAAGADHYSLETVQYNPLTPDDVGPNAYEEGNPVSDVLFVTSVPEFDAEGGTEMFTITSNTDWSIGDDSDWISVTPSNGSNNETVEVTVLENIALDSRSGSITITGGSITTGLSIVQKGANAPGNSEEITNISVSASSQQNPNIAENTLDKDLGTRWSAEGAGETITYDLGELYELSLLKIAFLKGDQRFTFFEVAVSEDGVSYTTVLFNQSNSGTTNDLENYPINAQARYVQIIGGGNSVSAWNSITEVEIYGINFILSKDDDVVHDAPKITLHPVPASHIVTLQNLKGRYNSVRLYSIEGNMVLDKAITPYVSEIHLDITSVANGIYLLQLSGDPKPFSRKVIIAK